MKILFLKNVARVGQAGEVKEVAQGHANFILKSGAGVVATDAIIKQNQKKIEEATMRAKGEESMAHEIAKRVEGKSFQIKGGANSKGSLYKAFHKSDVQAAITKEIAVSVPENLLEDVNLKLTGNHKLNLIFKGKVLAEFIIEII